MNNNLNNNQFLEIKTMFLSACEELCNRALRYDDSSRQAFAKLEGKVIEVNTYIDLPLGRSELNFQISFCENGLIFSSFSNGKLAEEVDAIIKVSSFNLFSRLLTQKDLLDGDIDIQGERVLVSNVQAILSELSIDWEEPLSRITGDVLAHEINRFTQDATRWLKNSGSFFETLFDKSIKFDSEMRTRKSRSNTSSMRVQENSFDAFKNEVAELSTLTEKLSLQASKLLAKHKAQNTDRQNKGESNLGESNRGEKR